MSDRKLDTPLSPRLLKEITEAARPASMKVVSSLLRSAWIESTEDIVGGDWLSAFHKIEKDANRDMPSIEAAVMGQVIRSIQSEKSEPVSNSGTKRVVDPAASQSTECKDWDSKNSKFSTQDYIDAEE